MFKIYKIILFVFFVSFFVYSCLDFYPCDSKLSGKYFCSNEDDVINYLELNENGRYFHYYKKGDFEISNSDIWRKLDDGYCKIELENWKNFNEKGVNYEEHIRGLLFINGDFLDISPDGNSSVSFKRESREQTSNK